MLEPVFGSKSAEQVLTYLAARDEGYAREIARFFDVSLRPIQQQLDKLELGGILVSSTKGRTRLYTFNRRYPFLGELKALLEKVLSFYPERQRRQLVMRRRRPRRRGKPL